MSDLTPLLHARSVAVVGISTPDRFGGQLYANLRDFEYEGEIYGVNPRYETLYDQPCYPSISALPAPPELVVLAVPNKVLLPAFEQAVNSGVQAAVIFGSAHSDDGEPRALENAIAALAHREGMPICGPNCMGFLSFERKLVLSGYPVIPGTPSGHITLISHSGSVFDSMWQNDRRVHFNYVISSGNETVTTLADYMHFALADPSTRVIALFLETVRDPDGFRTGLEAAAARDVPVIVFKVGRSELGARLAQSHSGALAGNDAVYDALFAYYGVRRVRSLDEFMDTLELFAPGWRPRPGAIAATLDSGGERGMLVDLAEEIGVPFAEIGPETREKLAATLDPGLEPTNPLDAWGTGNDLERIYRDCLLALDSDPATGLNVFAVDLMRASNLPPTYIDITLPILPHFQKPLIFMVNLSSAASEIEMDRLRRAGVPVLMGTETGLRAIKHLFEYGEWADGRMGERTNKRMGEWADGRISNQRIGKSLATNPTRTIDSLIRDSPLPLDEFASKQVLAEYGLPIPSEEITASLDDALAAAARIGYPVVLKTAEGLLHKSDAGGLVLDLRDEAGLRQAYESLAARFGPRMLVQKMHPRGIELILGLVNDPQFGMFLSVGFGGVFVEVFKEVRLLVLPTTAAQIRSALGSLRGSALLSGARGRPPVDLGAVVGAALALAAFGADAADFVSEVDVNPLIAYPDGVVAVDALIIPKNDIPDRASPGPGYHFSDD